MSLSFLQIRPLDILDILIVAAIIYRLLSLMKGTRAFQMLLGVVILLLIVFVAQWLQLEGLKWIVGSLKAVWVVAFVIVFQPELRTALAELGKNRVIGLFFKREGRIIVEVVHACQELSENRFGALIVFERDTGLRDYVETGTLLEATVSDHLLTTIFTPHTPLHDGAVIIRGETLVAAGCILPLSQDPLLARTTGMRHRAAIGITEVTDAISVVVSEETGRISLAVKGELKTGLDQATLRQELNRVLFVSGPSSDEGAQS